MCNAPGVYQHRPVLLVGLTGGIATGKTTVGEMFLERGIPLIDADAIVHELLEAGGEGVSPVRLAFGEKVVDSSGGIDRKTLGNIVFQDKAARLRLEQIVHPLVAAQSLKRLHTAAEEALAQMVIYDAALLVETGRHQDFHRLIVVTNERQVQLLRLLSRDHLDPGDAQDRLRSQMPLSEKAAHGDYVIDNSRLLQDTREQVRRVHEQLIEDADLLRAGQPLPARR